VSDLSTIRIQPITIELQSTTGLEVPSDCVTRITKSWQVSDSDGKLVTESREYDGVYVLWGNEIKAREVEVKYSKDGRTICAENNQSGWLKMYDEVVVNTKGLYNGKIIGMS
ncbi:MAG: hypothetical protein IJC18_02965, partial [Clostridia bacterium]|nr:hypothetical protein [Clostridia bacterium]